MGMSPLCESFLPADKLNHMEPFYPLHVWVCGSCFLVQLEEYVSGEEIFTEYAYFSSYASSWVEHAERYVRDMVERLRLDRQSFVVELASNDGYLLQWFVKRGIPCLGIEPARNVAKAAQDKGVDTLVRFFDEALGASLASEGRQADLIAGNNVLAQVPDLNSFVAGIRNLLKPTGTATLEFPHLQRLVEGNQFDTIYHEHFSYFSLLSVERILAAHELTVFEIESYRAFQPRIEHTKRRLLELLIRAREEGKRVVGYGAPGKGNTLLNFCGIRSDLCEFTVDRNPYKHGRFLPGTHIPIHPPERLDEARPDYVLILPWNFKDEIMAQLAHVRSWGGKFIVPIPEATVVG